MTDDRLADRYRAYLAAVPDLFFDARLLVTEGDEVGCRLMFDCTPQDEFLGFPPNGGPVRFAENVFYRFREGRIANVWSLIDRDAIRRQLAAARP